MEGRRKGGREGREGRRVSEENLTTTTLTVGKKNITFDWMLTMFGDSRPIQVAIHTVFHAESESAVRIYQFLHPEEKIKEKQPTRVSISYRKISYYMSPP